jgi:hypothetical protein
MQQVLGVLGRMVGRREGRRKEEKQDRGVPIWASYLFEELINTSTG